MTSQLVTGGVYKSMCERQWPDMAHKKHADLKRSEVKAVVMAIDRFGVDESPHTLSFMARFLLFFCDIGKALCDQGEMFVFSAFSCSCVLL